MITKEQIHGGFTTEGWKFFKKCCTEAKVKVNNRETLLEMTPENFQKVIKIIASKKDPQAPLIILLFTISYYAWIVGTSEE